MQTAQSPQAANELDILHQGHLAKTAKSLEESAPYEDALIAVRELEPARALGGSPFDEPRLPARGVERESERPAHRSGVSRQANNLVERFRGELGVGVEEQQPVSGGEARAGVHLCSAATAGRDGANSWSVGDFPLDSWKFVGRGGDHDLHVWPPGQTVQQCEELRRVAPDWNDDADGDGHSG